MPGLSKIPTRQLGVNGPHVSAVGFGSMGIGAFYGKTDESAAYEALTYAADRGVTFWDCADIYGTSEATLGKWFTETGRRHEIFLATKFGGWDPEGEGMGGSPISKPSYVKRAFHRSLSQLQTDYIDLYYQHIVDPNVPIEVVLEALREFVESGQIRWLGLSNCSVDTLRRAKSVKGLGEKLVVVQMEFSPFTLDVETTGFADEVEKLGMAIAAYSPLGRGMISGRYRSRADFGEGDVRLMLPRFSEENFSKNVELVDKIKVVADKYDATPSQIALAWILAEHPNFVPIPGSRSKERVEENGKAAELKLDPADVKAIRGLCEAAEVRGERYPEAIKAVTEGKCIPLDQWKGEN